MFCIVINSAISYIISVIDNVISRLIDAFPGNSQIKRKNDSKQLKLHVYQLHPPLNYMTIKIPH